MSSAGTAFLHEFRVSFTNARFLILSDYEDHLLRIHVMLTPCRSGTRRQPLAGSAVPFPDKRFRC
jgi:hypothetical protein